MKVIVTGATGFLGRQTARRLLAEGHEVTALGRNAAIGAELEREGLRFMRADLGRSAGQGDGHGGDPAHELTDLFAHHDGVIHCAALSSPWGRYGDFFEANVAGTRNVVDACLRAGVRRLVHVSTPSLYVDRRNRLDIRESDGLPDQAINVYAHTKRMAEDIIDRAVQQRGLNAITIRPQGIVGPGDTSILPRLLRLAKRGVMPVIGDGRNRIDLTYVDNVADSLVLALKARADLAGRKYNITNGEPVALYEMLASIFESLGYQYRRKQLSFEFAYRLAGALEFACRRVFTSTEPILTRYSVCVLGRSRTLNIDAAKRDLGYAPAVSMREAIERIVQDHRTQNELGLAGQLAAK